jgi:hypothetical protein
VWPENFKLSPITKSPSTIFTAATDGFEKNLTTSPIFFSAMTKPPSFYIKPELIN